MEFSKSEGFVTIKLSREEFKELQKFLGASEFLEYRDLDVCKELLGYE